jgi:hypothetical protein
MMWSMQRLQRRWVCRIDRRGLAVRRTLWPNSKPGHQLIRWEEIQRVYLGEGALVLATADGSVRIVSATFGKAVWKSIVETVKIELEPVFDLSTPTPGYQAWMARSQWTIARKIADLGAAVLLVIGMLTICAGIGFFVVEVERRFGISWVKFATMGVWYIGLIVWVHYGTRRRKKRSELNWRERR